MKILVSGFHNPLYLTIVEYIENSVISTGHNLVSFDDHQFIFPGRMRKRLSLLDKWDLNRVNRKLFQLATKEKPDLVIITQGFLVLKETIKKIKNMHIPIIIWVIDAPINFANILDSAPYYDYIFCGGTEAIEIFNELNYKNIQWLPFACDPGFHSPLNNPNNQNTQFSKDIVFVGSYYPSRARILESLDLDQYDCGIWGSGWDKLVPSSPLSKYIKKTHTKPKEWIQIFSSSKIILVTHYSEKEDVQVYQVSPKVYEALCCGGFVISDNQKDLSSLLKDGEHLVVFHGIKDLNEKIAYYLSHETERQAIAKRGRDEVLTKHTYIHRIEKMINTLVSSGIIS